MPNKLTFILISLVCIYSFKPMEKTIPEWNFEQDKSILIFKGKSREVIKFDENKNPESLITEVLSYHIINLNTNKVIFFYQRKGNDEWFNQEFIISSVADEDGVYEIVVNSQTCRKIYFEFSDEPNMTYSFKNGIIMSYDNLELLTKDMFDKLGIYDWSQSEQKPTTKEKAISYKKIKDFEFSEHWRKEAFKKSIEFIQKALSEQKPKCTMVKRSSYNPAKIKYIGNQGMQVKLYAEYDCNQDYINPAYFWVNAYYDGNGQWTFELEDHKLTH